jgi:hypothetical protein
MTLFARQSLAQPVILGFQFADELDQCLILITQEDQPVERPGTFGLA